MTTTKDRDAAIRKKHRKGSYRDPARDRGTSKQAKRKARRDKIKKDVRQVPTTSLVTEDDDYVPSDTRYQPHERMGIMFHALQTSIEEACEVSGVTHQTLYKWFREEGGVTEIKAYVQSKAEVSLHKMLDTFLGDLPRRLQDLDNEEYFETFRSMLSSAEKAGLFRNPASDVGKRGGGRSGESPEGTEGQGGIHFHITPPASSQETASPKDQDKETASSSNTSSPDDTPAPTPPEDASEASPPEDLPSVFDD